MFTWNFALFSEYEDYVSSLPTEALEYLKNEIDWDHDGVEEDLDYIAQHLTDWEEKLVVPLHFKQDQLAILKEKHKNDPVLLRYGLVLYVYTISVAQFECMGISIKWLVVRNPLLP